MNPDDQARLDHLSMVCANPSDALSAGMWCQAANEGLMLVRSLEEQLETVEKMVNHVFGVSGGGRWGPHGGWSNCPICAPALAVFGIDASTEAFDSNPASEPTA